MEFIVYFKCIVLVSEKKIVKGVIVDIKKNIFGMWNNISLYR